MAQIVKSEILDLCSLASGPEMILTFQLVDRLPVHPAQLDDSFPAVDFTPEQAEQIRSRERRLPCHTMTRPNHRGHFSGNAKYSSFVSVRLRCVSGSIFVSLWA
jgi:hypothetical protein